MDHYVSNQLFRNKKSIVKNKLNVRKELDLILGCADLVIGIINLPGLILSMIFCLKIKSQFLDEAEAFR